MKNMFKGGGKLLPLLIAVILVAFTGIESKAQIAMPLVAGDTIVNTGTVTKSFQITAGYNSLAIQPVVTRVSGTIGAGARVVLQASVNGTNWIPLDSLALTDVAFAQQRFFLQTPPPYRFYRLLGIGAGTMSAQLRVHYLFRKHD